MPRGKRSGLPNVSKRVKEHLFILMAMKGASEEVKKSIMRNASKELILALMEIISNVIYGNVDISSSHAKELKRHADILLNFSHSKTSMKKRREIVQQGGFLAALAGPLMGALGPLIGSLLGGVMPSSR